MRRCEVQQTERQAKKAAEVQTGPDKYGKRGEAQSSSTSSGEGKGKPEANYSGIRCASDRSRVLRQQPKVVASSRKRPCMHRVNLRKWDKEVATRQLGTGKLVRV